MPEYASLPGAGNRILHIRAEDATEADGEEVTSLDDTVNGYTFSPVGTGPLKDDAFFPQGQPALQFVGGKLLRATDAAMLAALTDAADIDNVAITVILYCQYTAQAGTKLLWGISNGTSDYMGVQYNNSSYTTIRNDNAGGHQGFGGGSPVSATDHVITTRFGGLQTLTVDGVNEIDQDPNDMGGGFEPTNVEINAYRTGNNTGIMAFGEFVIIGEVLSDAQVAEWETYLQDKYVNGLGEEYVSDGLAAVEFSDTSLSEFGVAYISDGLASIGLVDTTLSALKDENETDGLAEIALSDLTLTESYFVWETDAFSAFVLTDTTSTSLSATTPITAKSYAAFDHSCSYAKFDLDIRKADFD